ncbi:MAG: hypothetical protein LBO80_09060 [Treponema sp.]|nr:hypothetical protein [Treponema sp.]
MKKFPGETPVKVMLSECYFIERLDEQGTDDQRKELPPKLVKLAPAFGQRLAVE